jgi:DNA primase
MIPKEDLLKANKLALKDYCACLKKSTEARKYLYNRITEKTAKALYVGYAPNYSKGLKNKISNEIGYEAGLLNEKDGKYYEFFYNRIMFPIINNGTIIGFSGRTLKKDDEIKYLNTKATKLFNKSETLYVLDAAKKTIHEKNFVILVEGQFDVLTLIDHGIKNVVASCGTTFKDTHARLLKRWTNRVLICFDADEAGKKAALKAKKILKQSEIRSKIYELPDGHDAASYVKEFGADKLKKIKLKGG